MKPVKKEPHDYDDGDGIDHEIDAITYAVNCARDFAASKGENFVKIETMSSPQVCMFLKDMYINMHDQCQDATALIRVNIIREGLRTYFLKNRNFDVLQDKDFEPANSVFIDDKSSRNNKQVGLSKKLCRQRSFEVEDLRQIYLSDAMNLDRPETLQNKTFFDINLYVCNRGKDFLRVMTKSDFEVSVDSDGRRYVWLKYDPKFTFREVAGGIQSSDLGSQIGERMYERPGDPRCPVQSFLRYLTHLHPMCQSFWQRPKRSVQDGEFVWFDNASIGNTTLSKMMNKICMKAGVEDAYANQAIRPSFIQMIDDICKEALNETRAQSASSLSMPSAVPMACFQTNSSSVSGISRPDVEEGPSALALNKAKVKVLEIVNNLEAKGITEFVNWLGTFKVERGKKGLVVTCQPVEQDTQHVLTSKAVDKTNSSMFSSKAEHQFESKVSSFPLNAAPLNFVSIGDTSCYLADSSPLKVTIPSSDTVLLTCIPEDTQILLHKQEKEEQPAENILSRIYGSGSSFGVSDFRVIPEKKGTHSDNMNCRFEPQNLSWARIGDRHPIIRRSQSDRFLHLKSESSNFVKEQRYFYKSKSERFIQMKEEKSVPMKKRPIPEQEEDLSQSELDTSHFSTTRQFEGDYIDSRHKRQRIDEICNGLSKTVQDGPLNLVQPHPHLSC